MAKQFLIRPQMTIQLVKTKSLLIFAIFMIAATTFVFGQSNNIKISEKQNPHDNLSNENIATNGNDLNSSYFIKNGSTSNALKLKKSSSKDKTSPYYEWAPILSHAGIVSEDGINMLTAGKDTAEDKFMKYVKHNFGEAQLKKVQTSLLLQRNRPMIPNHLEGKLRGFYSAIGDPSQIIPRMDGLLKNDFKGAEFSLIYGDPVLSAGMPIYSVSLGDVVHIMDIPMNIQFANFSPSQVSPLSGNIFKINFDKEAYTQKLKGRINKFYDLKKYFLTDIDVTGYAKKYFKGRIDESLNEIKSFSSGNFSEIINGKISTDELIHLDVNQIETKVFPENVRKSMEQKLSAYQKMRDDSQGRLSQQELDSIDSRINDYTNNLYAYQQYFEKISSVKKELKGTGFDMNKFINMQKVANVDLNSYLDRPQTTQSTAENLLPLNNIQKIFLKLKTLKVGKFDESISEKTLSNNFMSGLSLSSLNKNNYMSGGLGKLQDVGMLKDAGFTGALNNVAQSLQYFRMGKGDINNPHTHFTVLNANANDNNINQFISAAFPRNTFVGTISKTLKIRKSGIIEAELSKSATQFRNTSSLNPGAERVLESKSALTRMPDDLLQTLSMNVAYSEDWEKIGLDHSVHVDYAGLGYNNPGNMSSPKGSLRYGFRLKKKFYQNKAFIQVRSDFRTMNYSADNSSKWNNGQFQVDGRFRVNPQLNLGFRLNQYQMVKVGPGFKERMYASRKAAIESQSSYTLGKLPFRTNLSFGLQQFYNIYTIGQAKSNMLMTTLVQSLAIGGDKYLTANVFYNKELQQNSIIGDLFTSDMALSYQIGRLLSLSSAITYLNNKSQAKQAGIRQSIQVYLMKKIDLSGYVDYRKDLIEPLFPYMYSNFRGDLSIRYSLN